MRLFFLSFFIRCSVTRATCATYIAYLMRSASLLAVGLTCAYAQNTPQLALPHIALNAGMYRIDAQVAATPAQRQMGLMFRAEMPTHEGMLFIFEQPAVQCFWMKNTLLPLTAAFVADDGHIVNLADMQAHSEKSHCSAQPVRYVLEMQQGWFAKRGLQAGSVLGGGPFTGSSRAP